LEEEVVPRGTPHDLQPNYDDGRQRCGAPFASLNGDGKGCCHDVVAKLVSEVWESCHVTAHAVDVDKTKREICERVSMACVAVAMSDDELRIMIATEIAAVV